MQTWQVGWGADGNGIWHCCSSGAVAYLPLVSVSKSHANAPVTVTMGAMITVCTSEAVLQQLQESCAAIQAEEDDARESADSDMEIKCCSFMADCVVLYLARAVHMHAVMVTKDGAGRTALSISVDYSRCARRAVLMICLCCARSESVQLRWSHLHPAASQSITRCKYINESLYVREPS